jgi:preprotein translocase subunit YajC
MLYALILFADDLKKDAVPDAAPSLFGNPMFLMIGLMVLFFFVVILPAQRKQKREAEAIMSGLKKNDEVVTSAGIIGIVANIKEGGEEVTLKIDDNARLRVLKSSIVRIINKKEEAAPAAGTTPDTNIKPIA